MSLSRHGHQHVLFFFQKSLRNLFWSAFLRQNGIGLVDIFTFVYLYRLGVSEQFFPFPALTMFQQGILTVVADVLILRCVELIVILPLSQIASKLGLPKAAILGNCLMAIRYALLAFSTHYPYLIFTAAIIQGIEMSVFSPAYDTMFSKRATSSRVGRDVGAFSFMLKLSYALLPVFAGGLIVSFGFQAAFIGSTLLLLLSNIPLLNMHWKEHLSYPTAKHFMRWVKKETDPRILVAIAGRYLNDVGAELWPIYLVLVFGKIESLGVVMSLALFTSLILVYFSGWYVDHSKRNLPFVIGGVILGIFWLLRINILLISFILVLEIGQRIVESFVYPSYDAFVYRLSKSLDTFSFHVYREALICIVSLVVWAILGVAFLSLGAVWNAIFLIAAAGIIFSTLLYTV